MRASRRLRVGPALMELTAPSDADFARFDALYRDYPRPAEPQVVDCSVHLTRDGGLRGLLRPRLHLVCDHELPGMAPIAPHLELLALEMGMNLQMAAGWRRQLVFHAGSAAQGECGVVLIGDSGAGKSTLAAMLGLAPGWRFMGDEFALLSLDADPHLIPYPRPISLKNDAIAVMEGLAPADRFGPRLENTVKGTVRHLLPPPEAIAAMDVPARPVLVLAPHFDPAAAPEASRMTRVEAFVRLSQSAPNYSRLGEAAFQAVTRLADRVPAYDIHYGSGEAARHLIGELLAAHG